LQPWVTLTFSLGVASAGCLLMIVLRVAVTGSIRYTFLLWNLFLAWNPYFHIGSSCDCRSHWFEFGFAPQWP